MFSLPSGEDVANFETYLEAQNLVNALVSGGVPARALAIVGSNVSVVERITGRVGYGRAALSSAMSGSWLGALAGLAFITHEALEADLVATIAGLEALDAVRRVGSVIRVVGGADS